MKKLLQYKPK